MYGAGFANNSVDEYEYEIEESAEHSAIEEFVVHQVAHLIAEEGSEHEEWEDFTPAPADDWQTYWNPDEYEDFHGAEYGQQQDLTDPNEVTDLFAAVGESGLTFGMDPRYLMMIGDNLVNQWMRAL